VFLAASDLGGPHSYARIIAMVMQSTCYASRNLTDGFLPLEVVRKFHDSNPLAAARSLVKATLWEQADGGFQIHDFLEYNPSSTEIKLDREWDRKRKELYANPDLVRAIKTRDRHCCRYCGVSVNWSDRRGPIGGQFDHVEPRGANTFENVVVACRRCNNKKNNRTPEKAGMILLPVQGTEPEQIGTSSHPLRGRELDWDFGSEGESEGDSPVPALIRRYHDGFIARFGEKPNIQGRKDGKILKDLAKTHGVAAVEARIDRLLDSTDDFIANSGRTIGVLSSCWNKLAGPLRPGAGNARPQGCRHMPACADDAACTKRRLAESKGAA
jgi:hypothetical protein